MRPKLIECNEYKFAGRINPKAYAGNIEEIPSVLKQGIILLRETQTYRMQDCL